MSEFVMPSLGADMEAGTLVEWLKGPGDTVARSDIIAVVETQKGAIEIEVYEDGVIDSILVDVGTKVPVGTPLAMIRGAGEAPGAEVAKPAAAPIAPEPATPAPVPAPAPPEPAVADVAEKPHAETAPASAPPPPRAAPVAKGLRITPAARRLAQETGADLSALEGLGHAITRADVLALQGAPAPEPVSGMRAAIAAAMSRSKREIPHYYLSHTVDVTASEAFVAKANEGRPPEERLLIMAVWVKAIARALRKYPEMNGHLENEVFTQSPAVHAGVAINIRGGGLVAPALHDAETLTLDETMTKLRDLIARVRAGRFRAKELSDPTITISSLGDRGVERLYGVIYPPQVAIIGVGTPVDRPWLVDGAVAPRRIVTLTLAADHRVSDGHRGALFLRAIDKQMQKPEAL